MRTRTIVAAGCAVAALSAGEALAAKPDSVVVLRVNETTPLPAGDFCDFPVTIRETGHLRIKEESSGRLFINTSLTTTITGPGGSITSKDRGLDRFTPRPDGTVVYLATGIHFQVRTAGGTKLEQGIGARKIVFDIATGDVISLDYKNPNDSDGSDPCTFID